MSDICQLAICVTACSLSTGLLKAEGAPDISSVPPDLEVPAITVGQAAAGRRVKQTHPDYRHTQVYHVVYLPEDWQPGNRYPVIVEYAGNGPYKNALGDVSTGFVEGSRLGYGLSAGKGFIWLCLPYLNQKADTNVRQWWGDQPAYDPGPTIDYCKKTLPWICEHYGGDPGRVVLAGFSRGAIACNFIGLHDPEIAKLWRGFVAFSHYDGVIESWPYPGADRGAALARLKRLGDRPQFILGEGGQGGVVATQNYLQSTGLALDRITFAATGFRNHNDAWILRPSPARKALRKWLRSLTEKD